MAKDYFQDILPPENNNGQPPRQTPRQAVPPPPPAPEQPVDDYEEKSIRNVTVPNRMRPVTSRESAIPGRLPPRRKSMGWLLWLVALVALVAIGIGVAVSMRKTTVTLTARTQPVSFDSTYAFTAYPEALAASDTLPYLVQTFDFEDSDVVPATGGAAQVDHPASGSATVINNFSAAPVKLIKNTRFETPDHLIFRTPSDITVPGKKGTTPGKVTVTLVADQPGSRYNVGPVDKFTLPGLKSNAAMYTGVYASSEAAMTGGSAASESGVSPQDLAKTITALRARLQAKTDASIAALASTSVAFATLTQTTFTDEPSVVEGNNVRVKESIHVAIPVFDPNVFAQNVAKAASVDTQGGKVLLASSAAITAAPGTASSTLGVSPITFTLSGKTQLVWQIDANGIAQALAGKDRNAFQTTISTFSGIQDGQAQVAQFWSRTFPQNPKDIVVDVKTPAAQ